MAENEIDWALRAEEDLSESPSPLIERLLKQSLMKQALAEAGGSFIRDRLREVSFARRILPPNVI